MTKDVFYLFVYNFVSHNYVLLVPGKFRAKCIILQEDQKFFPLEKHNRLFQCFGLIILKLCVFLHKVAWDWKNVGGDDKTVLRIIFHILG